MPRQCCFSCLFVFFVAMNSLPYPRISAKGRRFSRAAPLKNCLPASLTRRERKKSRGGNVERSATAEGRQHSRRFAEIRGKKALNPVRVMDNWGMATKSHEKPQKKEATPRSLFVCFCAPPWLWLLFFPRESPPREGVFPGLRPSLITEKQSSRCAGMGLRDRRREC